MGRITLRQAAAWCGGQVEAQFADITFLGANNDSRKLQPGQLFIALQGERDGHDFIPMAMEKGAAAVLCSKPCPGVPAIVVADTRLALGDIAREERKRIGMKVVGVTGSVGKSTTKEMIAQVLQGSYRVAKTPVNQNNDIGMPMAILSMAEDTEVAVLEMGMNHFREIAYLSNIAAPDIGVIVNIGTMHIEHLGTREGILRAKMEILEGMGRKGLLLLNGDDDLLCTQKDTADVTIRFFGWKNENADLLARQVQEENGAIRFSVKAQQDQFAVSLMLEGRHYVLDAMAAVAVGLAMNVAPEQISCRLEQFQNMEGRQEIFEARGYTIIKDCYNAGPESMAAALRVLANRQGRKIAVLGDMLELGTRAKAEHYQVGRTVAETADMLLAYGENSERVVSGAITGGLPAAKALCFIDRERLVEKLKILAKPGDTILFKGSRGMRMELALEGFLKET